MLKLDSNSFSFRRPQVECTRHHVFLMLKMSRYYLLAKWQTKPLYPLSQIKNTSVRQGWKNKGYLVSAVHFSAMWVWIAQVRCSYTRIFQLTNVCSQICLWLDFSCRFISCIEQNLKCKKFSLKSIECDFSWSMGSGASWGFSVLKWWGTGSLSDTTQSRWGSCSFFPPLAWF